MNSCGGLHAKAMHLSRGRCAPPTRILHTPRHSRNEEAHIARCRLCPACITTTSPSSPSLAAMGLQGLPRMATRRSSSLEDIRRCIAPLRPHLSPAHQAPTSLPSNSISRTAWLRLPLHKLPIVQATLWS